MPRVTDDAEVVTVRWVALDPPAAWISTVGSLTRASAVVAALAEAGHPESHVVWNRTLGGGVIDVELCACGPGEGPCGHPPKQVAMRAFQITERLTAEVPR